MQPPIINIFEKAARKAGKVLIRDFGEIENLQIQSKNLGDFVTNADLNSEKILIETLQYYYPNASFITEESGVIQEESGVIQGDQETIIIDPIDGTTNFIHGIPMVSIVIGKLTNNEITDGIIFNPILNEFYWASKGKGAWCNNKRLRVSKRKDLIDCLIGNGIPNASKIYNDEYLSEIDIISKNSSGIRRMGSAALDLAYVAAGKFDAFWERDLNLWDVSAGVLLVKEAGGKITEANGNEWNTESKNILASNLVIHDIMAEKLK